MFLCCWDIDRLQQGLVAGRPIGAAGINEQSNDGREQLQSSNEPCPVCLPGQQACVPIPGPPPPPPPPPPVLMACTVSHSQPFLTTLFSWKKNNVFGVLGDQESISYHFFYWSFSECGDLAVYPIYWSCVIAAVGFWWLGFRACHRTPPPAPPPRRLLALSMRMAPFPRHHSAGTAFTVNSVWMEIYRVGKGRRQRDEAGR